jgi:hypothetical protein
VLAELEFKAFSSAPSAAAAAVGSLLSLLLLVSRSESSFAFLSASALSLASMFAEISFPCATETTRAKNIIVEN